jgi:hypothetical protein
MELSCQQQHPHHHAMRTLFGEEISGGGEGGNKCPNIVRPATC